MSRPTPLIRTFFDPDTCTATHVVYDHFGGHAAVIDPVLDFDQASGRTSQHSIQVVIDFIHEQALTLDWILETHAHADHLSAAPVLQQALGGRTAIGRHIRDVQGVFKTLFNLESSFPVDGSQFDHLLADGDTLRIGELEAVAWHVPGHTPADLAYVIGDAVFVGDTLFLPDVGTARCDFPGGDASLLYRSIQRLLALPSETRLFMCHDYPPHDRPAAWECTVAEQRQHNIHVHEGIQEADFVALRHTRDATLGMPRLILPSIQVNIRGGRLPEPEANGLRYLKLPMNAL